MRSNLRKMRTQKVSKKAPEWKRKRMQNQLLRINVIDRAFDMSEPAPEAVSTHLGRRYPCSLYIGC